jgi:hypothetical protein
LDGLDGSADRSFIPLHIWPLLLAAILLFFLATTDGRTLFVTAPLALGLLTSFGFLWVLWRRRYGSVPWFEIGAIYAAVVTLYMAYPLVGFLALGQKYTAYNDARLFMMQPDAAAVGRIGSLYCCHLIAFAAIYLLARGRLPRRTVVVGPPHLSLLIAVVVTYAAIECFVVALGLFYDTSATSYLGTYLVARRLPLLLGQLLNHLGGIRYVLSLMLLVALFSRYPATKGIIIGWLGTVGVITIAKLGSRTEFVLLVLSATFAYDTLVRPIRPRLVVGAAVVGLTAFIAFGAVRNGFGDERTSVNPFSYASEFESLFANALHLQKIRPSLDSLPVAFYLADFAAILPQQLAPFTKIDRGDWYVNRFFPEYASAGGGLAFGSVSESVLTGGWLAALAAGGALGFCFGKLHRFYTHHARTFWVFILYLWVTTLSYQSLRNSTFALLVLFAYRFVPAVVFVNLLSVAIRPMMVQMRPLASQNALKA